MNATPLIRRINSVDSCDRLVRSLHGDCTRSGVWSLFWHTPDGRLVARSTFERRGLTNRLVVAPTGESLPLEPSAADVPRPH